MQKPDYFAEFRPLFHKIVARQKADRELKILHIHFSAPVEEVAHMTEMAKTLIEEVPWKKNANYFIIPFLMFIIKMFDGIVGKSTDSLLLDFTTTERERESVVLLLTEITTARSTRTENIDAWADTMILMNAFLQRIITAYKKT